MYGLVFRLYGVVFHEETKKIIIHNTESLRIRLSLIYAGKSYKGNLDIKPRSP